MSTIICNRAPAPGSVGKVGSLVRFSLRDDAAPIRLSDTNLYYGYGNAIYTPTEPPEGIETPRFALDTFLGNPDGEVTRAIVSESLRIEKAGTASDNLKGTYFFGGLEAPMVPEDPFMVEFRLLLNDSDVSPAPTGDQFTGVSFGFFIGDTGLMVRFYHNTTTRWIEIHRADQIDYPAIYTASYDWDGLDSLYKIVWDPRNDRMWLLLSTGEADLSADTVLVDGKVSDFPGLPSDQQRAATPVAFFGHTHPDTNSVSYWKYAGIFNDTAAAIIEGVFQGPHVGFIRANESIKLDTSRTPRDGDHAWEILPDSYGTIEGEEEVIAENLVLRRTSETGSFGFYRNEPAAVNDPCVVDFRVRGRIDSRSNSGIQVSGFEVYVNSGARAARVGFCDNLVTQHVGILGDGNESLLDSYIGEDMDWASYRRYRLVLEPSVRARLFEFEQQADDFLYVPVSEVDFGDLPTSSYPQTGIGFGFNALVGGSTGEFYVSDLHYLVNAQVYSALDGVPTWAQTGSGSANAEDGVLTLDNESTTQPFRYSLDEGGYNFSRGAVFDFGVKVDTWGVDEPWRSNVGPGAMIDDGVYQATLLFAEGGPELGKIIYVASDKDYDRALLNVRSGLHPDSYYSIDWTKYHSYRIERGIYYIRVYIDNGKEPVIELDLRDFQLPFTEDNTPTFAFGALAVGISTSMWTHAVYSTSTGYDIGSQLPLDEEELLEQFGKASNVVVTADASSLVLLRFDTSNETYEDFDEEWSGTGSLTTSFSGSPLSFDT